MGHIICCRAVVVLACVHKLGDARLGREEEDDLVERERGHEVEQEPSLEVVDGDPPRLKDHLVCVVVRYDSCTGRELGFLFNQD